MSESEKEKNVFRFQDEQPPADIFHEYTDSLRAAEVPIVIDNGSFQCRVGWASEKDPRLVFKNVLAKQRSKKDADAVVGNDISNIELVRWQLKSQFDRNVVTQYDAQEQVFDYIFSHLGINSGGSVDHPIVITEPVCNPNYCRQQMSELLFECYRIPKVAYGIDSLFSFYNNFPTTSGQADALLVSCGYHATHILPVLSGKVQAMHCRRISVGGSHVDSFMQRLLQLKYPAHLAALTLTRAEELLSKHSFVADDYMSELQQWLNEDYFFSHVHKMQLPYTALSTTTLSTEQVKDRKEQQGKRLRHLNARRRLEKLTSEQGNLDRLLSIQEMAEEDGDDDDDFQRALQQVGYTSTEQLNAAVVSLRNSIQKIQQKMLPAETDSPAEPDDPQPAENKRQKTTNQALRKSEKQDIDPVPPTDKEDVETWLTNLQKQRQDIVARRLERRQRRIEMTKRRTVASQHRMKIITALAQGTKKKKEDTFGQNDDDWNVYKEISRDAGETDSEAEQEKLDSLETLLRQHDPDFVDAKQQTVPSFDMAEYYRLYVGVERMRVPELLFQPSMMGIEQAGIAETIDFILHKFSADDQSRLVQNVFITGGCGQLPGFQARLQRELLSMRPFQSHFHVTKAELGDAWAGAARWARSAALHQCSISRMEYEEKGGEYLKEHIASNCYIPTPHVT